MISPQIMCPASVIGCHTSNPPSCHLALEPSCPSPAPKHIVCVCVMIMHDDHKTGQDVIMTEIHSDLRVANA
eukprot:NODE_3506_length_547_cov_54.670683_g2968_i0.p3 GENE.NODE_3506_length_547_cov_54.670683_g2968_i0~~NODE_3506_length_547_cov_54.670683_g2968_i0.p3  ORF type:complete len:72 (+),score=11.81 NODE_3506_length_547_cov_54.670683_g2968_i0:233-448(+)